MKKAKKIVRFVKRNFKKALVITMIAAALIIGYEVLHNAATDERGYNAIGGEIFIFAIPYLVCVFYENYQDSKKIIIEKVKK